MSVVGWVAAVGGGLGASGLARALLARSPGRRAAVIAGVAGVAGVSLCGAGLAAGGPVPVAAALAGVGLAAAVAVDVAELRIPARLALGTAGASALAFVIESPSWALVGRAAAATAVVVGLFGVLWLAGGMGYGDVRLALAVVPTAAAGGGSAVGGLAAFLWGASVAAGVTAVVMTLAGRRRSSQVPASASVPALAPVGGIPVGGRSTRAAGAARLTIPFAPAIAVGWILALIVT